MQEESGGEISTTFHDVSRDFLQCRLCLSHLKGLVAFRIGIESSGRCDFYVRLYNTGRIDAFVCMNVCKTGGYPCSMMSPPLRRQGNLEESAWSLNGRYSVEYRYGISAFTSPYSPLGSAVPRYWSRWWDGSNVCKPRFFFFFFFFLS